MYIYFNYLRNENPKKYYIRIKFLIKKTSGGVEVAGAKHMR